MFSALQMCFNKCSVFCPVLSMMVLATVVLLLHHPGVCGQQHFYQRFYSHMFAVHDKSWQDRECLLTLHGREYVGTLKTPAEGYEYLKCLPWDKVAAKVAKYDLSSKISDNFFPGFKAISNQHYCRNPGGIWSQPGCFLQYPKSKEEEKHKTAACGVPLCPVLTQLRSNPTGMEFGDQLDLRNKSECVDKCDYRHTLLGPACTLTFDETLEKEWQVYYPCDVPILDGETLTLRANIKGVSEGWNIFTPITWYLTPGEFIDLRKGAEGRMLLRLPHNFLSEGRDTSMKFHLRLGDPMDVDKFEFEMFLSPDTSLLEVVVITIDITGIHLVYKVSTSYKVPKKLSQLVEASNTVPWATLMYRWLDLELTIRATSVKVTFSGAEKDDEDMDVSDFVELSVENHVIQTPKYIHMASLGGTTLATISSINGCGYACTEGIVKFPLQATKYYQWAVLPKTIPTSTPLTTTTLPNFNYPLFSDRKLRIQIFNAPFSLWLSSAPILPSDMKNYSDISHRKLNVVQILVGLQRIVVMKCGVLKAVYTGNDVMKCYKDSQQMFTTDLKEELYRGQEVVVDVAASEKPDGKSSLVVRVELPINKQQAFTYTLSHPVFPRYWTLVKTKNIAVISMNEAHYRSLYFRILNNRCKRTQSFLQSEGCMTQEIKSSGKKSKTSYNIRSLKFMRKSIQIVLKSIKNKDYYDKGPMFQQKSGMSCLSWAAFAATQEEQVQLRKLGNQCFYEEETQESFCLNNLWGRRDQCEVDHCFQNTMPCFDRADVVPAVPFPPNQCIDGNEVMLINVAAFPSPANPTHLIFGRKYDFEIKSGNSSLNNMDLCIYLYTWKTLKVIFRIGPQHVIQNLPGTNDQKTSGEASFMVPWRYTPYSLVDAKGEWMLFQEEYAIPLLTYYSRSKLDRIGFDSCHTIKVKLDLTKVRRDPPSYVLVKLNPQKQTPTMSHYFQTSYFPEPQFSFNMSSITEEWQKPFQMMYQHNTFFRVAGNQFKVWVKGNVLPSTKSNGAITIFLMEQLNFDEHRQAMIYIDRHNLFAVAPKGEQYVTKHTLLKRTMFPQHQVEVDVKITYISNWVKIHTILSTTDIRLRASISVVVPQFNFSYVALSSYNSRRVHWSMGDKMPHEDPTQKPTDGGWSKWIFTNCSKPCGGGKGVIERSCTNPKPSLMGKDCKGPRLKKRSCNLRKCGLLTQELEDLIQKRITKTSTQKIVKPFSTVKLVCPRDLINRVADQYPDVTFFWQHHTGRFFQNSSSFSLTMKKKLGQVQLAWLVKHVHAEGNTLVIDSAVNELSGLWFFVAKTTENILTVVFIVPLVVEDTSTKGSQLAIEGDDALLFCNARGLSKITKGNIQQVWLFEGEVHSKKVHVDTTRDDILLIPEVHQDMEGVWECVNTHMQTGVEYRTSIIKLKVLTEDAKYMKSITDIMYSKTIITMIILACGISFLICIYGVFIAFVTQDFVRKNKMLRGQHKKLNKMYINNQIRDFILHETTSRSTMLPHLLHRPSTPR